MKYHLVIFFFKKGQDNAIYKNMNGPKDCHTEWSKSDTQRQMSYDTTYMWNPIKEGYRWTYLQNRIRVTDVENKFMATMG